MWKLPRAAGGNVKRYVFMSSVAAYGGGHNARGDARRRTTPPICTSQQSHERARAIPLHQRIGLPMVTLRPPYIYGPGNPYYREAFFWDRLRADRSIIIPGTDDVSCSSSTSGSGEGGPTGGRACGRGPRVNIANAASLRPGVSVRKGNRKTPKFVRIRATTFARGRASHGSKLYFGVYHAADHAGHSKAQRVLKFKPTDFATGLNETHRWYLRHHDFPKPDFGFEDSLLANAPVLAPAKA
jgi:nucleoside-diphosphate-sugar epimerase